MPAVAAANESAPTPAATLDPRLLMAARRGDSWTLKDLLQLNDDDSSDDQQSTTTTMSVAVTFCCCCVTTEHVIVEVDPQRDDAVDAPLPSPPVSVLDEDEATIEGESLSETVEQVMEPPPPHDDDVAALPARQTPAAAPAGHSAVLDDTEEGSQLVDSEIVEQVVVEPPLPHDDAAPPARQPPAAAPTRSFPAAVPVLDEDGVTMEGDSLLHVVAASGDTQEYLDCAKMIVRNKEKKGGAGAKRRALEARNNEGDTPLHCAAGAGNAKMIGCLICLIPSTNDDEAAGAEAKKALVRTQNECGETALHQAIRAARKKKACIDQLMGVDPELACIPHEDGASPLYLAISLGEIEIAKHLYVKSNGKLSYSGPDGRNVLHATVHRGQALQTILGWLVKEVKQTREEGPTTVSTRGVSNGSQAHPTTTTPAPGTRGSSVPAAAADCLLTQLTSQRDRQQKGSTPLHLAASLEGWSTGSVRFLQSPQVKSTELLLGANLSTAYQADDDGGYPIHVAARARSLDVVKMLLERCPDCATIRDGKGRTFLHVAVEVECFAVVRYVVWGRMPHHLSRMMILNAQDSSGETALHGAVRAGNLLIFNCLFRNRLVRLDMANKLGMTPLDLSYTMIPAGFYYGLNPRIIVRSSLVAAGAPHGGARPDLFFAEHIPKRDIEKESEKHTVATQVMCIVTALVATVTFASAFQLPGGYRSADSGDAAAAGTPVRAGSFAFNAFILADTLAFICSMGATCLLVYAGLPAMDISIRNWYFNVSAYLLQSATRSLMSAIALGLYLVLAPVDGNIAVAVCVIVFATSVYGNMAAAQLIYMAITVLARIGIPRPLPTAFKVWARSMFRLALIHFGSYVIIFGLPAILKWAHQKHSE